MKRPEIAKGYGLLVGGPRPFLAGVFEWSRDKAKAHVTEKYHKIVKVKITLDKPKKASKP